MCLQEMCLRRPSLCAWWRKGSLGFLLSCGLIPGNAMGKWGEVSRRALLVQVVKHDSEPWRCVSPVFPSGAAVPFLLIPVPECLGLTDTGIHCWLVFLMEGSSQAEQLPQGGKCPSGGDTPVPIRCTTAMVWLHRCANCVVLVKLGLFVNLLRCLDGWLATDFIGQY